MAMMVGQQDTVPCQCPDGCTVVYYIKQLSQSDAACSKQIKLPKTEARRFVGDLRHKQRSLVAVMDHQHVLWEFLCTCYGCQYALSRVAVFCNTYQLCAGQYLMFYRDALKRLRISVSSDIPDILYQHCSIGSRGPLQRRLSQISPPPAAAAAGPNPAINPAAACSTIYTDQSQTMFSSQVTMSPSRDSNVSTDDLRRSSSSGVDSDHSIPASQASRDSSSDRLAAVAAAAVDSGMHSSRSWEGQGVITNAAASCSSRQQLRQLAPAAIFGGGSTGTAADLQQQLLLLQAGSGLMPASLAPQQELLNASDAAAMMGSGSGKSPNRCTLVCHEQLSESPAKRSLVLRLQSTQQQQQQGQRDQSHCKPDRQVTAAAAAATTAVYPSAVATSAALGDVATKSTDQAKLCMPVDATGTIPLPLNQPYQQQRQQFNLAASREPKPVLNLGAVPAQSSAAARSATAATVPSTAAAAAAAAMPAYGSKRSLYCMSESLIEPATKRQHVTGRTPPAAAAAAVANAAATDSINNTTTSVSGNNRRLLRPGCTVWPAEGTGSKFAAAAGSSTHISSRTAYAGSTNKIQADHINVQAHHIPGGCRAATAAPAAAAAKAPLMQNCNCCNVTKPVGQAWGRQPTPRRISRGATSSSSRSCFAENACAGGVCLPGGSYGSHLTAFTAWQPAPRQQQHRAAAAAGAGGSCSERVFHTGMWQQQQQQQILWANICAQYSGSSSSKNAIAGKQMLPLFQTAACGTAAAAAAVRNKQYEPKLQSKGATAVRASAAARSKRSSTPSSAATAATEASSVIAAAAAAGAAAPRMVPPKLLYKQQQQQHKLLQQQVESNQATDETSAAAGASAAAEDHGSEWSAVCGLLMLSRN